MKCLFKTQAIEKLMEILGTTEDAENHQLWAVAYDLGISTKIQKKIRDMVKSKLKSLTTKELENLILDTGYYDFIDVSNVKILEDTKASRTLYGDK